MLNAVIEHSLEEGESLFPEIVGGSLSHDIRTGHLGNVSRRINHNPEDETTCYCYDFDILNFNNETTSFTGMAHVEVNSITGSARCAELFINDSSNRISNRGDCLAIDAYNSWKFGRDLDRLMPEDQRVPVFQNQNGWIDDQETPNKIKGLVGSLQRFNRYQKFVAIVKSFFGKRTEEDNN